MDTFIQLFKSYKMTPLELNSEMVEISNVRNIYGLYGIYVYIYVDGNPIRFGPTLHMLYLTSQRIKLSDVWCFEVLIINGQK